MQRFEALDRLRALAVLLMVQGHTFTALMRPNTLPREVERVHGLLHGLTAPAFLFGAGLAFGLATYGRYERHRVLGPELRRRLWRYASLLAVGYALQLPGASLWAAFHVQGAQLSLVCRVGPLQLIALTLGLCQLAILIVPTPRLHAALSACLGLAVLLCAEWVGRAGLSDRLPLLIGAFFDDAHGSQFPLFPWAGFALFGVGLAGLLVEARGSAREQNVEARGSAREQNKERARLPHGAWFVLSGASMVVLAYLALTLGIAPFHQHWFWRTSPTYFCFRLGLIVVVLGLLSGARVGSAREQNLGDSFSALLARRSLTAYVVHLLLLYGTPFTPNLVYRVGGLLSLEQTLCVCALIFAATLAATWLVDWLDRERKVAPRYTRAGIVLLGLTLLVR